MFKFSQLDPTYSRNLIGDTKYTIKQFGCTICSLCTMFSDMFKGEIEITPTGGAKLWSFTKDAKVYWNSIAKKWVVFIGRYYHSPDHKTATEYINDKNKGIVLEINDGTHWVYPIKWGYKWFPYFFCADPYTYNWQTKQARVIVMRKSRITGYSIFHKV